MLALMAMLVPSLLGTTTPEQEKVGRAKDDPEALKEFQEAYRLAPGANPQARALA